MEEIQDYYTDEHKRKYEVKLVGENLAYLRGDNWGHVKFLVAPLVDGVLDLSRAKEFHEKSQAIAFIYQTEQKYPVQYVSTQARAILEKFGKCQDCSEAEAAAIKEDNTRRLQESQQRVVDLKNNIKTDE